MLPNNNQFSPSELAAHRAASAAGQTPSLETVRKFILTIRRSYLADPSKVEKGKKTRNAKPKPDEKQIDFF